MITQYKEIVSSFEKIDSAKAQELMNGDGEAVIYIGRALCPFCQRFVRKLKKVADETNAVIYHIDSGEKSDIEGITEFRSRYNIPTVPGFIYTNGDTINVKCDSSMSEEEIKTFMNK